MKPIGPYVAARELPGSRTGVVRTLRATDRLTGMPVLLHVLPRALSLPELPAHPHLLPIIDSGMDGDQAYVVTELALQAQPASDPLLAARGALAALAALHARGQTHGGVNAAQLWSVDGRVALAGAGLPWRDHPAIPQDDLSDLVGTLEAMGVFPKALEPLRADPGAYTAAKALDLLNAPEPAPAAKVEPAPVTPDSPPAAAKPLPAAPTSTSGSEDLEKVPPPAPLQSASPSPAMLEPVSPPPSTPAKLPATPAPAAERPELPTPAKLAPAPAAVNPPAAPAPTPVKGEAADAEATPPGDVKPTEPERIAADPPPISRPHDGSLIVLGDPEEAVSPVPAEPGPPQPPATAQVSSKSVEAETPPKSAPSPTPESATPGHLGAAEASPAGHPVPAFSTAPAGTVETPQERRKRQNEERRAQAMLDAKAAAERKAQRLKAEAEARAQHPAPEPIQIGFSSQDDRRPDNLPDDLPDWPPADGDTAPRPGLNLRDVPRLPESLRRPEPEATSAPPAPAEPVPTAIDAGHLPSRRMPGEPIRIGWDEDESWRVVKTVPPPPPRAPLPLWSWVLPTLAALALVAGAIWWTRQAPGPAAPVAAPAPASANCCEVAFTVSGAPGVTALLSVEQAPAAAKLAPGQELGRAPGRLRFPVAGAYRLKVAADGYAPATLNLTLPRSTPVNIDLRD